MKRLVSFSICFVVALACTYAIGQDPKTKPALKPAAKSTDLKQDASYCIGLSIGRNFKNQDLQLDPEQLVQGLRDALGNGKARFSDEEAQQILAEFQTMAMAQQQKKAREAGEKNKKEGAAFLAANGQKAGVKTTKSGLQYQVLKEGSGASPKGTDTVKVHYKGTLLDGTTFDSTYDKGEPLVYPVARFIKGWNEGLQLMKVGGKIRLFVPSELAYGENPDPSGPIPPNAVLIFDMELLDIVK